MYHINNNEEVKECRALTESSCPFTRFSPHFHTKPEAEFFIENNIRDLIDKNTKLPIKEMLYVNSITDTDSVLSSDPDYFIPSLKEEFERSLDGRTELSINGVEFAAKLEGRNIPTTYEIRCTMNDDRKSCQWRIYYDGVLSKRNYFTFNTDMTLQGESVPYANRSYDKFAQELGEKLYEEFRAGAIGYRPKSPEEVNKDISEDLSNIFNCVGYVEEKYETQFGTESRSYEGSPSYLHNYLVQPDGSISGNVSYYSGFDSKDLQRLLRGSYMNLRRYVAIDLTVSEFPDAHTKKKIGNNPPSWKLRNIQGNWYFEYFENGQNVVNRLNTPDDAYNYMIQLYSRREEGQWRSQLQKEEKINSYRFAAKKRAEWARKFMIEVDDVVVRSNNNCTRLLTEKALKEKEQSLFGTGRRGKKGRKGDQGAFSKVMSMFG